MTFAIDNRSYVEWIHGWWRLCSADSKGLASLVHQDLLRHDAHALHALVVNALRGRAAGSRWWCRLVALRDMCEEAMQAREAAEATEMAAMNDDQVDASALHSMASPLAVKMRAEQAGALSYTEKAFGVEPAEHEMRAACGPAQCPHCYTRPDPSDARACCPRVHEEREAARAQRRARFDADVRTTDVSAWRGERLWVAGIPGVADVTHPVREGAIEALWAMLEEEAGR